MQIDWLNAFTTLIAAVMGGWIAAIIAKKQIATTIELENAKRLHGLAYELLDTLDTYLNTAFRGEDAERQRCGKKAVTLSAILIPAESNNLQKHFNSVESWHRARKNGTPKPAGVNFNSCRQYIEDTKKKILLGVFKVTLVQADYSDDI